MRKESALMFYTEMNQLIVFVIITGFESEFIGKNYKTETLAEHEV